MKSTKLKAVFFGLSCFAVASTFAQDSPKTPKPDTTKWPKHDSTSLNANSRPGNTVSYNVKMLNSFVTANENINALKTEAENEILTKKSFANISA
jgi:hypothetical protein